MYVINEGSGSFYICANLPEPLLHNDAISIKILCAGPPLFVCNNFRRDASVLVRVYKRVKHC